MALRIGVRVRMAPAREQPLSVKGLTLSAQSADIALGGETTASGSVSVTL